MTSGPRAQRLLALFAAGWMLLNFPLLALWDRAALLFGFPLLPVALFAGWAALIGVAAWVLERGDEP
jgi:hypothetical protein